MKELRNCLTQKSTRLACGAGKFILPMGQGPDVLGNVILRTQERSGPVVGVVDPVLLGYGPFQDRS